MKTTNQQFEVVYIHGKPHGECCQCGAITAAEWQPPFLPTQSGMWLMTCNTPECNHSTDSHCHVPSGTHYLFDS